MLKLIQIHVVGYVLTNPTFWNRIKVFPSPCHNFNVCLCPKRFEKLKSLLLKAGFTYRSAKGSHTRWVHPLLPNEPITIAGNDGDDAKLYLEREVNRKIGILKAIEEEEPES